MCLSVLKRVALEEAKRRERGADERAAAAEASRRQAEAAAAAAERRAADAECLRREGSSAAVHVQSQLQSLQQSLQVLNSPLVLQEFA